MFRKTRVYLDYAAATPLRKEVLQAMMPYLKGNFGNPSAIHSEGVVARQAIEAAREKVGSALQVRPEYVTFTSGGTESNNIALIGTIEKLHKEGRAYSDMEIVTTHIEHPSITEAVRELQRRGVEAVFVGVTEEGAIKSEELQAALSKKTVVCSVAYANSEIGVVQKVRAIKKILEATERKFGTKIFFHIDAAQAPLWLSCQRESLLADLLSLDAGKCNGPKGVGILVRSRRVEVRSVLFGGGQESGMRPGTENVASVVGAGVAIALAQKDFKQRAEKVAAVRDLGITHLLKELPQAVLNGPIGEERLANNINISIPGLDTEFATVVLDKHGFAVSTKSACAGAGGGESVVVKAISSDPARSRSTLRISLSPETTLKDIENLTVVLKNHCAKMSSLTKV